jgi:hypothetical protein
VCGLDSFLQKRVAFCLPKGSVNIIVGVGLQRFCWSSDVVKGSDAHSCADVQRCACYRTKPRRSGWGENAAVARAATSTGRSNCRKYLQSSVPLVSVRAYRACTALWCPGCSSIVPRNTASLRGYGALCLALSPPASTCSTKLTHRPPKQPWFLPIAADQLCRLCLKLSELPAVFVWPI